MKTIFDKITRDGLIDRINSVTEDTKAGWGKMNAYQMVRHCILYEDMMLGKTQFKRAFIGYLFGKMALRSLTKDETPLSKSTPPFLPLWRHQPPAIYPQKKRNG